MLAHTVQLAIFSVCDPRILYIRSRVKQSIVPVHDYTAMFLRIPPITGFCALGEGYATLRRPVKAKTSSLPREKLQLVRSFLHVPIFSCAGVFATARPTPVAFIEYAGNNYRLGARKQGAHGSGKTECEAGITAASPRLPQILR